MTVRVLEVAQQELDEAIAYYNGQAPGLGDAFLLETVAAITSDPGLSARRMSALIRARHGCTRSR